MVALLEGNPELLGALRDAAELHGRVSHRARLQDG
jgi:hypothetical protein